MPTTRGITPEEENDHVTGIYVCSTFRDIQEEKKDHHFHA